MLCARRARPLTCNDLRARHLSNELPHRYLLLCISTLNASYHDSRIAVPIKIKRKPREPELGPEREPERVRRESERDVLRCRPEDTLALLGDRLVVGSDRRKRNHRQDDIEVLFAERIGYHVDLGARPRLGRQRGQSNQEHATRDIVKALHDPGPRVRRRRERTPHQDRLSDAEFGRG